MFCPACQQDVPAIAVPEEPGVVRCAFCSEELEKRAQGMGIGSQVQVRNHEPTPTEQIEVPEVALLDYESCTPAESAAFDSPEPVSQLRPRLDLEDWELEPQLRAAERLLKGLRQEAPAEQVNAVHAAHQPVPDWHVPDARPSETPQVRRPLDAPKLDEKSGTLAWTCLSLGVMALACGGVLVAWSLLASRDDLWSIGLPLAVIGQGGLVIGLLLQLDGLWRTSRKTEETLTHLDGKLHDLAHTATMLGTTRSTPAQSFYVHMAEGASPHLLLADLKGQLDLLAERMSQK